MHQLLHIMIKITAHSISASFLSNSIFFFLKADIVCRKYINLKAQTHFSRKTFKSFPYYSFY